MTQSTQQDARVPLTIFAAVAILGGLVLFVAGVQWSGAPSVVATLFASLLFFYGVLTAWHLIRESTSQGRQPPDQMSASRRSETTAQLENVKSTVDGWIGYTRAVRNLGIDFGADFESAIAPLIVPDRIAVDLFVRNFTLLRQRGPGSVRVGLLNGTPSAQSLIDRWSLAVEPPDWFIAAYPDVTIWLDSLFSYVNAENPVSRPAAERLIARIQSLKEQHGIEWPASEVLRLMVDAFSQETGATLECRASA